MKDFLHGTNLQENNFLLLRQLKLFKSFENLISNNFKTILQIFTTFSKKHISIQKEMFRRLVRLLIRNNKTNKKNCFRE